MNATRRHIRTLAVTAASLMLVSQLAAFIVSCLCLPATVCTMAEAAPAACCTMESTACCASETEEHGASPASVTESHDGLSLCACQTHTPETLPIAVQSTPTQSGTALAAAGLTLVSHAIAPAHHVIPVLQAPSLGAAHVLQCSFRC